MRGMSLADQIPEHPQCPCHGCCWNITTSADKIQNARGFQFFLVVLVSHGLHPVFCDAGDAVWQAFSDELLVWRQLKKRRALLVGSN